MPSAASRKNRNQTTRSTGCVYVATTATAQIVTRLPGADVKRHAHGPSSRLPRRLAANEALHPGTNVPPPVTTALSFGVAFRRWHDRAHHLAMIISQFHRSRFSIDVGMPQDAERKSLCAHDIQGASILFNAIAHWSFPPDAIPGADAFYHHALGGRALGTA